MEFIFDESEIIKILQELNLVMAGIFGKSPREIRFVFLHYITTRRKNAEVLGQCIKTTTFDEIQILLAPGWQNTAVHELVHAYCRDASEVKVKKITKDVIKYLKIRFKNGGRPSTPENPGR